MKNFNHLKRHYAKGIWKIMRNFNFKFVLFAFGYPSTYRVCEFEIFIIHIVWQSCAHIIRSFVERPQMKRNEIDFTCRFSPVCSIDFMDMKQRLHTFWPHFYRADFSTFIRNCQSYHTALRAPLKLYGNAFYGGINDAKSQCYIKWMRCHWRGYFIPYLWDFYFICEHFIRGKRHRSSSKSWIL